MYVCSSLKHCLSVIAMPDDRPRNVECATRCCLEREKERGGERAVAVVRALASCLMFSCVTTG